MSERALASSTTPQSTMAQCTAARTAAVASSPGNPATDAGSKRVSAAGDAPAKRRYVRVITEKRREQCRRSQSKYRRKQMQTEVDIEVSVQRLRLQVLQLEDQRRTLYHAVNSRDSAVRLLMEFCSVFRHGVRAADSSPAQHPQDQQLAFVANHLHRSVRIDDNRGRDVFMQQTRLFSAFYDNHLIELLHCSDFTVVESSLTMKAHQRLQLTVSDTTIQFVFPHLLRPEHHGLRAKLLGARLRLPVCALFVFDESGLVLELDWVINFVSALQQIMLSVEEIAVVLEDAHIVRDSYLLDTESVSDVTQAAEKDMVEDHANECGSRSHRNMRWYEDERWRRAHTQVGEFPERMATDRNADGEGYLIHDGKGDDYVMV